MKHFLYCIQLIWVIKKPVLTFKPCFGGVQTEEGALCEGMSRDILAKHDSYVDLWRLPVARFAFHRLLLVAVNWRRPVIKIFALWCT